MAKEPYPAPARSGEPHDRLISWLTLAAGAVMCIIAMLLA
jgi:hypothetical protein